MNEAEDECRALNAVLPLPRNEKENNDTVAAMKSVNVNNAILDIKLNFPLGKFVDFSGQPVTYTNWASQHPNGGKSNAYLQTSGNWVSKVVKIIPKYVFLMTR